MPFGLISRYYELVSKSLCWTIRKMVSRMCVWPKDEGERAGQLERVHEPDKEGEKLKI
jgi:hypothetical protein